MEYSIFIDQAIKLCYQICFSAAEYEKKGIKEDINLNAIKAHQGEINRLSEIAYTFPVPNNKEHIKKIYKGLRDENKLSNEKIVNLCLSKISSTVEKKEYDFVGAQALSVLPLFSYILNKK